MSETSLKTEQRILKFTRNNRKLITLLLILVVVFLSIIFYYDIDTITPFSALLGITSLWVGIVTYDIAQTIREYKSMESCKSIFRDISKELMKKRTLSERISDTAISRIENCINHFKQCSEFSQNESVNKCIAILEDNLKNKQSTNRNVSDTINRLLEIMD